MSTSQPRCSQGSTRKTPSRRSLEELEDAFGSTRKPAVLDYEELGGFSDPEPRDCTHGVYILGLEMGHGPCPTPVVTIHTGVELVRTEANYSSSTRVGFLTSYLATTSIKLCPPRLYKGGQRSPPNNTSSKAIQTTTQDVGY
jgi:hypothetical protein